MFDVPGIPPAEPSAGVVKVSTSYSAPEALARIIVEDNGSGISPENLEKIFTLFTWSNRAPLAICW